MDPYGCEKEMKDVEKRVDKFHTKIIDKHRRAKREREDNTNNNNGEMDFVDVLLSLPGENGKEHMDDVEIKALIQVLLLILTKFINASNSLRLFMLIFDCLLIFLRLYL